MGIHSYKHKRTITRVLFLLMLMCSAWAASAVYAQTASPQPPPDAQLAIEPGDTITGELAGEIYKRDYVFEGKQGDRVTIALDSFAFDPLLTLYDEDGTEIALNDDAGGSLNALIEDFELFSDGTYRIVATSADGQGTGGFTLSLNVIEGKSLTYGEIVEGELTDDVEGLYFRFDGYRGDFVEITLDSDAFDPFMHLAAYMPDAYVMSDDSSGVGSNAMIIYHIQDSGPYYVYVTRSFPGSSGPFTLRVREIEAQPIAFDEPITATFEDGVNNLYFGLDAIVGDRISINVDSAGALDTVLMIISPGNYVKWWEDDSGAGFEPELIRGLVDMDGTYILNLQISRVLDADAPRSVSMTVTNTPPITITPDEEIIINMGEKQQEVVLEFISKIGVYTVRVEGKTDTANLNLQEYQDGYSTHQYSGGSDISYFAPYDSDIRVRFILTDYSYRDAEYRFILTPPRG